MKKKVFLIDDDEMILTLMAALTRDVSWLEFSAKSSPVDAVTYLAQCKFLPDLILIDLRMPEMDGIETLRLLKKLPCLKTTLFSIFSTAVDPENVERAKNLGAGYIVKDYDLALDEIKGVLGIKNGSSGGYLL